MDMGLDKLFNGHVSLFAGISHLLRRPKATQREAPSP